MFIAMNNVMKPKKSIHSSFSDQWSYTAQPRSTRLQYIPRNMHTVFALLCFVVVIHWLIFPYPSGLLHWHCGNLAIAPVPAKQPWWIWVNTSCEFIMNDCITTTKQSTTKPCAYFLGYTVCSCLNIIKFVMGRYWSMLALSSRVNFRALCFLCFYLLPISGAPFTDINILRYQRG